jgi:hypothetical protein
MPRLHAEEATENEIENRNHAMNEPDDDDATLFLAILVIAVFIFGGGFLVGSAIKLLLP